MIVNSGTKFHESEIHGFYEDHQKYNSALCVTVHPNTKIGNTEQVRANGGITDVHDWVAAVTPGSADALESISGVHIKGADNIDWSSCYQRTPIFRSIFYEDFHVDVINEWSTFDGGNAIESIFKSIKPMAPMLQTMANFAKKANNAVKDKEYGGTVSTMLNKATQLTESLGGNVSKFMNNALRVQGTKYAYYDGSDVNFSSLSLKSTLFSGFKADTLHGSGNPEDIVWRSCVDQLKDLSKYIIGIWRPFSKQDVQHLEIKRDPADEGKVLDKVYKVVNQGMNELGEYLEEQAILAWQIPPAGYLMDKRQVGVCNKGTFRLVFGNMYTIENLVIKSASISYSRALCKNPFNGEVVPLYAEVNLQFQPSGNFSSVNLKEFIGSQGMDELHYTYNQALEKNLDKEKEIVDEVIQANIKPGPFGPTDPYPDEEETPKDSQLVENLKKSPLTYTSSKPDEYNGPIAGPYSPPTIETPELSEDRVEDWQSEIYPRTKGSINLGMEDMFNY